MPPPKSGDITSGEVKDALGTAGLAVYTIDKDKRKNQLESDPAYNQIKAQIESEYQKRKNQLMDELRREKNMIADNLEKLRDYRDAKVMSMEEYNSLKSIYDTMSNQLNNN